MQEGSYIKGYKLLKEVGRGSFGIVYKASDASEKIYAIKVIFQSNMSENAQDQVEEEVRIFSKMDHPCIVRYKEAFLDNGRLFLVTEFIYGGSLNDYIEQTQHEGKRISDKQIISWMAQICMGISHIHSKNIVHRDLKPENILLTNRNFIKITDFGLSKQLKSKFDKCHTFAGTKLYMAPEQFNQSDYSKEVDYWALGIILYILATLEFPYNTVIDVMWGRVKPIPNYVSSDIKKIIQGLLVHDPKKRMTPEDVLNSSIFQKTINSMNKSILSVFKEIEEEKKERTKERSIKNFKHLLGKMDLNKYALDQKGNATTEEMEEEENRNSVKEWKRFIKHMSPYHPHPLSSIAREGIPCNVCKKEYKSPTNFYYCVACDFNECEQCKIKDEKNAENPSTVPAQPEMPSMPYMDSIPTQPEMPSFNMPVQPTTAFVPNDSSNIPTQPEMPFQPQMPYIPNQYEIPKTVEEDKKETKKEIIKAPTFKSKYHEHELTMTERVDIICDNCKTEFIYAVNSYYCSVCDFDLCFNCKREELDEAKKKVKLDIHPHPLLKINREFNCDGCYREFEDPKSESYNCPQCDFDLCKFCKEEEEKHLPLKTKMHPHPLKRAFRDYICDICKEEFEIATISFYCEECDHDECRKCFYKNK